MEQLPRRQPVAHSVEACIGQKLQLIGDQFHREHLQLVRRRDAHTLKTDTLASSLITVKLSRDCP